MRRNDIESRKEIMGNQVMTKKNGDFPLYIGIFFFSWSVLLFELSLTRTFSILQWNYLAFMIISIAFLGYGASGTFLSVFSSLQKRAEGKNLFKYLLIFSSIFSLSTLAFFLRFLSVFFETAR